MGLRKMKIKILMISFLLIIAVFSGCISNEWEEVNEENDGPTDDPDFINESFPSKVGQTLKYEISKGNYRYFIVQEKLTFRGHDVYKVGFGSEKPTQYAYVDSEGKIWKVGSNSSYMIYDYDNSTIYNNRTDSTEDMPENFMYYIFHYIGIWWKHKDIDVGDSFEIITGADNSELYIISFSVYALENITVPAGCFEVYNITVLIKQGDLEDTANYWIEKDSNILIKWATSPDNGDELYSYNL